MSNYKIMSRKWYGRFLPSERKKVKLLQILLDHQAPEIDKKVQKAWQDYLFYGKPLPKSAPNRDIEGK